MPLEKDLKILSIILLAKKEKPFDSTEINQYWLDSKNIIPAKDIDNKKSSFTPFGAQVFSKELNILFLPDQIQISPSNPNNFETQILNNAISMIEEMSESEFAGIGINFNWFMKDENSGTEQITKKYFYSDVNPASIFFNTQDAQFGSYLSKNIDENIRLKLNITPVSLFDVINMTNIQTVQFLFNFHSSLIVPNQKEKVIKMLKEYDKWLSITKEIMDTYK